MKRAARYIIFYAALLGLWTLIAELKIWPPYLFPTPWGVAESLYAGFQDHTYWIAIRVSTQRVLIGYGISVVLGMILGLGVASNKFLEETMGGLLVSLQSLPSICWWRCSGSGSIRMQFCSSSLWDHYCQSRWRWKMAGNRCRRFLARRDAISAPRDSSCSGMFCSRRVCPLSFPG